MKDKIIFPDSFTKLVHPLGEGWQWKYEFKNITISIVGGMRGLYGDGIKTFEMWDMSEDQPQGYLSAEDINKHLSTAKFKKRLKQAKTHP